MLTMPLVALSAVSQRGVHGSQQCGGRPRGWESRLGMIIRCLRSGAVVYPLRADGLRGRSLAAALVATAACSTCWASPAGRRFTSGCCPRSPHQAPNARSRVRGPGLTCGFVWWARQGLNLWPLPCQLTRAYRCANRRFPRSRSTVDGKVKCCLVEGRYAHAERGRGGQKPPGQLHSAHSLLISLGSRPALTCTDSYCAQPTPYQEPPAAPPRSAINTTRLQLCFP
jgi:hypothetical protein